jgi:hypothetical protein
VPICPGDWWLTSRRTIRGRNRDPSGIYTLSMVDPHVDNFTNRPRNLFLADWRRMYVSIQEGSTYLPSPFRCLVHANYNKNQRCFAGLRVDFGTTGFHQQSEKNIMTSMWQVCRYGVGLAASKECRVKKLARTTMRW